MGEGTAQAVDDIEVIRERLEAEVTELQDRLPEPVVMAKRLVGIAIGGGLSGMLLLLFVRRIRRRARGKKLAGAVMVVPRLPIDPAAFERLKTG